VALKEKVEQAAAMARRRLTEVEAEMARVVAENTHLKKMVKERDEKLSSLATELATLKAVGDEELLKQSFLRVFRQAHVLYGGSPVSGAFDLDHEVYQSRIMPIAEMKALVSQQAGSTEGKEDEKRED